MIDRDEPIKLDDYRRRRRAESIADARGEPRDDSLTPRARDRDGR